MEENIKELQKRVDDKFKELKKCKSMIKGSINERYAICGKPNCKCTRGEKHLSYQLSYKQKGNKTKTMYLKKTKLNKARKMIDNYQKAKVIFDEIIELNTQLLKIE